MIQGKPETKLVVRIFALDRYVADFPIFSQPAFRPFSTGCPLLLTGGLFCHDDSSSDYLKNQT
jgi:hypothetical protein